ncbi:MAG: hypothetical protein ABWY27_08710 [Telluria sp.]
MTKMAAQIQTMTFIALIWGLCLGLPALAQAGVAAAPPLSGQELAAVTREIAELVRTPEAKVDQFVVRDASPERIDRFFSMPELAQQPRVLRENALALAGQGTLLTFDKPSDVIRKVSSWFPAEVAAARASKDASFFTHLHLYGPFKNWNDEPAAFLGLWNCMPQLAWLKPDANPFIRRLHQSALAFMPIGASSSSIEEYDFGFCIRQRSGSAGPPHPDRVAAVLSAKFSRFLASNRCHGSGPDDCALMLHLWAGLSPADTRLAAAIQALEAEVAPDSPLPPLAKPAGAYAGGGQEGEARFDDALRRAAFLRAKLQSVLHAPAAWPPQALAAILRQLTRLRTATAGAIDYRRQYYELDYHNDSINPWRIVAARIDQSAQLRGAVMAELNRMGNDAPCEVFEQWFKNTGESLQNEFALQHLADSPPLKCAWTKWDWLRDGKSAPARELRKRYLDVLDQSDSAAVREKILSKLSGEGELCFDKKGGPSRAWLEDSCKRWISERQHVALKLPNSRLSLSKQEQFQRKSLQPPAPGGDGTPSGEQEKWLAKLVQGLGKEAGQAMQARSADLGRQRVAVLDAHLWRHPRSAASLLELQLNDNEGTRIFLVLDPHSLSALEVPDRFGGSRERKEIVHVSDLDHDGRLELWWADEFRRCKNGAADLERELDCTARSADMGEISANLLTYFSNSQQAKPPGADISAAPAETAADSETQPDSQSCNAILVGSILGQKLDIDFGGGEFNGGRGDLIELVCKDHPGRPGQTIVALFHDLKNKRGDDAVDKKGFAVAVIDAKRRLLHGLHRGTVEEEATIRVGSGTLSIDTARYHLAPGVRAFGVRMNIGYSPRCAEGGENGYLTLFVEEGRQLRPVLSAFPMSSWQVKEGSEVCGDSETGAEIENTSLTLALSASSAGGWRDLDVVARTTRDMATEDRGTAVATVGKPQVVARLRKTGKGYQRQ